MGYMRKNRLTALVVSILLMISMIPAAAFADAIEPMVHDDTTVRVYLTMSYDSDFLRAGNDPSLTSRSGKVLARVPVDISYTDLMEYGLEGYYRYDKIDPNYGYYTSSSIAVQPTVLMLYLRATSLYYLEREIRADDLGTPDNGKQSDALTMSGGAQSLYFTRFWGHGENLMYYVNHEYPMWYADQGATADYILLTEGDEIDLGMFSNMSFNQFGAFSYFDRTSITSVPGEQTDMSLLSTVTHEGSVLGTPLPGETIRVSSDYGETWTETDITTSDDGSFSISFAEPGVYYISAGPDFVANKEHQMACIAPPISVVEIKPVQVTGGKTSNPSQSTVTCTWDSQGTNVTYKVDYRNTGDSTWKTTEVTSAEITVSDVDPEKCEFRITPIVRSEYVAYGESAKKLTAKASAVIRHSGYIPPDEDPDEQARILAEAKQAAINNLQNYKSPDLYREAEQATLSSIIESGTAAINSATTVDAVQTAYNNAVSSIDGLKTKAQYEAEEQGQGGEQDDPAAKALAEAKTNAKTDLVSYKDSKDLTLYRDEQKEELVQIVEQGSASIDGAQTTDEVAALLTEYKGKLDEVKTDAQMTEEEAQAAEEAAKNLKEAKDNAKVELGLYMAPEEYRDAEKALLLEILAEGEAAINAASTEEAVKALLTEYKGKIDQLKTIAQYEAEEELAQKVKAAAIKKAKAVKTTVKVKALTKHRAKVTWKKVNLSYTVDGKKYTGKVTGYKVYRATKKTGKYKLIKTIKKAGTLKYTDKKLKKGRKYYYKVRTYTKIDGGIYLGKWTKVKKITAK